MPEELSHQFHQCKGRLECFSRQAGALCPMVGGYLADATPEEAWRALQSEPGAVLVDVRTAAEWSYVGLPDLTAIGRPLLRVEWQSFPSGAIASGFAATLDAELKRVGASSGTPVFFICRSGARSAAAAAAMTAGGYSRCYNVAGGFEGQRDGEGHRGTVDGWKAAELPWTQS